MANRPWQPSEDDRKRIRLYSGLGLTQEQIAAVFGKSVETIVKYCRDELDAGKAETIAERHRKCLRAGVRPGRRSDGNG